MSTDPEQAEFDTYMRLADAVDSTGHVPKRRMPTSRAPESDTSRARGPAWVVAGAVFVVTVLLVGLRVVGWLP